MNPSFSNDNLIALPDPNEMTWDRGFNSGRELYIYSQLRVVKHWASPMRAGSHLAGWVGSRLPNPEREVSSDACWTEAFAAEC
jgi:hypothetical protein